MCWAGIQSDVAIGILMVGDDVARVGCRISFVSIGMLEDRDSDVCTTVSWSPVLCNR